MQRGACHDDSSLSEQALRGPICPSLGTAAVTFVGPCWAGPSGADVIVSFNRHSSQFTITFRLSTHKHITRSDARIITKHGVVAASATSILFSVIGPSINLPSRYYITRRVGVSWKLGQAKTKRPGKSWPWRQRQIGVVGGEKRVIENASRT